MTSRFSDLHQKGSPLVMPNPWDIGTARLFASLGFQALATTSSGFAATLGRLDYGVTRSQALAHCAEIAMATDLPVNADLEACFADEPEGVAETVRLASATGLAGCSIEDWSGEAIYPIEIAKERVVAAAEAAHGPAPLLLTARSENYLRGFRDLSDTILRLQSFQEAGADVLYAPGLSKLEDIAMVVSSVDRPVNVLILPGGPTVAELASVGVSRISVGSALNLVALGAVANAARELLESGTHSFWPMAAEGSEARNNAFVPKSDGPQSDRPQTAS